MICANILLYLNLCLRRREKNIEDNRLRFYVEATVIWMLCLFLSTEILSLLHGISFWSLWGFWLLLDAGLALNLFCKVRGKGKKWLAQCLPLPKKQISISQWGLVLIGLVVVVLALLTVPYNWDSMTYRLPRIAYWVQNGSVEHFATNCSRALANPPLGEFVQLQIYVMTGKSDLFLNLMQAFSYLICSGIVYGLAKRLSCNGGFCFLASLLFMTTPIAFSEALNTQVDLFSAVWLLTFVYLVMDFTEQEERLSCTGDAIFKVCILGLCVAWGYLSKPNVCVAMLLFVLWLLLRCIVRRDRIGVLFRLACCALGSMIVPIGWELSRNIQTFHALSSPIAGARQLVGTLNPKYLLVNFLKNFTYNLPFPQWKGFGDKMTSGMWQLSAKLGVSLNAETISEDGRDFFYLSPPNYAHDTAINPLLVWLVVICGVLAVLQIRKVEWKQLYRSYTLVAYAAFGIFCVILRWEPFVTRYMVGFLALLCPAIAFQLQKFVGKKPLFQECVMGFLCLICIVDLAGQIGYHSKMRTVYGAESRPYGYFTNRSTEYESTMNVIAYIREQGYEEIGIYHGEDDYEYPYWALLKDDIHRIEHVNVTNESKVYVDTAYQPQAIIWYGKVSAEGFCWNGISYQKIKKIASNRYVLTAE